jgi:hypothetical protein
MFTDNVGKPQGFMVNSSLDRRVGFHLEFKTRMFHLNGEGVRAGKETKHGIV